MSKIIFFDTETTGVTEKDYICQIAYKVGDLPAQAGETFNGLYKPPIKIPPESSAVHHITNKMVADKLSFSESPDFQNIKKLFEDKNSVLVAHNASFDVMMIKNENIIPKNFICTLKVARHLDPEGKIGKYNLQYLRYFLDLDIEATAHDALGDVMVLEKLFDRLNTKIMESENLSGSEAIQKMIDITSRPSLLRSIPFGKHIGKTLEEVVKIDPSYLEWLLKQKLESDQVDEDWIYTLKYYLKK